MRVIRSWEWKKRQATLREMLFPRLKKVEGEVKAILEEVEKKGDEALISYTRKFDGVTLSPSQLRVSPEEVRAAFQEVEEEAIRVMREAKENIEAFYKEGFRRRKSWSLKGDGLEVGEKFIPLQSVGLYIPGGRAPLFSTVLMTTLPAKVAGVKRLVMVTPPGKKGRVSSYILAAAFICEVQEIYRLGGAQAIGALAYGTQSIPRVDKIVGPGNVYVTAAKKLVFGRVDIDMLAGPSEVVVLADKGANPRFIACDLLAQMEHDPDSLAILVSPCEGLVAEVIEEIEREEKIPLSAKGLLERNGIALIVKDVEEGVNWINSLAPEHLEIHIRKPREILKRVKNAGAIFLGEYAPVTLGDYMAGPSHVLPTGGWARVSSGLGVDDFLKRLSFISCTKEKLEKMRESLQKMAEMEGLEAHRESVEVRFDD